MEAPNSVILVSQYKTVSPRSPANSNFINDLVGQTGADLNNLKSQFNKLLTGVEKGVDETIAWGNEGHGLDAHSLFYDSTATTGTYFDAAAGLPKSIHDIVGEIETTITELPTEINITAEQVSFDTVGLPSAYTDMDPANVQEVLVNVINSIPELIDGEFTAINSSIITWNGDIIPDLDNTYNIGAPEKIWATGHFNKIFIGGTEVSGDSFNTDAASVTYDGIDAITNEPYKHYQDSSTPTVSVVANVKQALDLLGDLDSDPEFNRAGETLKGPMGNIVTTVVGTQGMTVSEWLTALFFPFEPAVLDVWNVHTPKEKGTTLLDHTCNWVVAPNDGQILQIEVGLNNGSLSDTGATDASGSHTFPGSFSTNTTFQIQITCDTETGILSDSKELQFFARFFYGHFPQSTNNGQASEADILAMEYDVAGASASANLSPGYDPSKISGGFEYKYGPEEAEGNSGIGPQHIYIAIPTSYRIHMENWEDGTFSDNWKFVRDLSNFTTVDATDPAQGFIPINDSNKGNFSINLPLKADQGQTEEYLLYWYDVAINYQVNFVNHIFEFKSF